MKKILKLIKLIGIKKIWNYLNPLYTQMWLLEVEDDMYPKVHGPFESEMERTRLYDKIREERNNRDGLYRFSCKTKPDF